MKNDSRQERWYCITEDTYLHEDFFNVINETGCKHIEILHVGSTSHFIIDILSLLKRNLNFSPVLSDIEDELLSEGYDSDVLEEKLFQYYQELYEPQYFYFFDTDRLRHEFFPTGHSEAVCHQNKLMELNQYVVDKKVEHFFLIPSFPSLASFAWLIHSYIRTSCIETINSQSTVCKGCKSVPQTQVLYKECCVICKMQCREREILAKEDRLKEFRGYGKGEKKFFCVSRKCYPFLEFLKDKSKWNEFYKMVCQMMSREKLEYLSLNNLRISEKLIHSLTKIDTWYSAIPTVIEVSRNN